MNPVEREDIQNPERTQAEASIKSKEPSHIFQDLADEGATLVREDEESDSWETTSDLGANWRPETNEQEIVFAFQPRKLKYRAINDWSGQERTRRMGKRFSKERNRDCPLATKQK